MLILYPTTLPNSFISLTIMFLVCRIILSLFLILEEKLQTCTIECVVRCGLSCLALIMLTWFPSTPSLLFYHEKVLNLGKSISTSIEMIMWVSSLILLIWCVTLIEFHMLNHSCIPRISLTWSWCITLSMCRWI